MSTKRKKCRMCGKRKVLNQFYRREANKDGYTTLCKHCYKTTRQKYSYSECEECGELYYHRNGHTICQECRKERKMSLPSFLSDTAMCDNCAFLRECKANIWRKTFEPYCFAGSKYHGLYKQEYHRTAAR